MRYLILITATLAIFISSCSNQTSRVLDSPEESEIRVKPYFSSTDSNYNLGGGIDEILISDIKSAEKNIKLAIYGLTNDNIRDAIIYAHKKGVDVKVATDDREFYKDDIVKLKDAGIEVFNDEDPSSLMHHKFMVIDENIVWSGSANYTYYAFYKNNENLVKITSPKVAKAYIEEFDELYKKVDKEGAFITKNLEIYFSPEDDFKQRLLSLIEKAKESIDFLAFAFTDKEISNALKEKHDQGVKIRGVFDEKQNNTYLKRYSQYSTLLDHKISVKLDGNRQTMHNKVFIIDKKTTITGSYNFTKKANQENRENSIVIHDREFAKRYLNEFETIWLLGEN